MISSETATFMKWGGLGMVASELPEAFNACFGKDGHSLTVVTPLYLGDTGKKKTALKGDVYEGAEHRSIKLKKIKNCQDYEVILNFYAGIHLGRFCFRILSKASRHFEFKAM